jgi:hypothetical protein
MMLGAREEETVDKNYVRSGTGQKRLCGLPVTSIDNRIAKNIKSERTTETDPTSRCLPAPHLRMETGPVSEKLCSLVFLEYRTMDKVQKPGNPDS